MIDLHTHSTFSDGTLTPSQLIDFAISQGITHLALTDHDTVKGIEEAEIYARNKKIKFVGGVEVSAEFKEKTMHILGYNIGHKSESLNKKLEILRQAREDRNPKIVEKLNQKGFDITYEEVVKEAEGKVVGRPHFSMVMLKKGYVKSTQEAFDKYLAKGACCYVDKFRFEPEEAVRMILEDGGIPVLAHPLSLKMNYDEIKEVLKSLKDKGLEGVECFYRNHTEEDEKNLVEIAKELQLIVTGGSDFHGSNRPNIFIGIGEGKMRVPMWVAEDFFSRIEGTK
ncbi:MAG: PHP domain-containing protein [Acidobacteria bacterium]|nr:PHP domain-containing protein [Acidobacteriota bacterium]